MSSLDLKQGRYTWTESYRSLGWSSWGTEEPFLPLTMSSSLISWCAYAWQASMPSSKLVARAKATNQSLSLQVWNKKALIITMPTQTGYFFKTKNESESTEATLDSTNQTGQKSHVTFFGQWDALNFGAALNFFIRSGPSRNDSERCRTARQ